LGIARGIFNTCLKNDETIVLWVLLICFMQSAGKIRKNKFQSGLEMLNENHLMGRFFRIV